MATQPDPVDPTLTEAVQPPAGGSAIANFQARAAATSTPADQMPAVPAPINPSAIQTWLVSFVVAGLALSGLWTTALHYWEARDLLGALVWIRSSEFIGAMAPIITAAGLATWMYRTYLSVRLKAWLARRLPNEVAFVVGEEQVPRTTRAPETVTAAPATRLVQMPTDPAQ